MADTIPEKLRALARDRDRHLADATLFRAADVIEIQIRELEAYAELKTALAAWLPAAKARHALFGDNLAQAEIDMIHAAEKVTG